ncbi:MAG TPA: PAS domain S-box protein [Anaeromyxobacteraceae bacterium]|nr:PAS domain S-box protein [Anaeromyxobacteraceae bacterium]
MSNGGPRKTFLIPAGALVAFAVGGAALTAMHLKTFEATLRANVERELGSVADLKLAQLADWRSLLMEDAASLAELPHTRSAVLHLASGPAARGDTAQLLRSLETRIRRQHLTAWLVVGADGEPLLMREGRPPFPFPERVLREAAHGLRPTIDTLAAQPGTFVVAVPVRRDDGGPGAAVLLAGRLSEALPVSVRAWPSASHSAEAFLGIVDGERIAIEPLGQGSGEAPRASLPLGAPAPLARAARGDEGVGTGTSEEGRAVLAARRRVPDLPFSLVVQVEEAEVLAPLAERTRMLGLGVAALLALTVVGLWAWWRRQAEAIARREREVEDRRVRQRLELAWAHSNDIVIVCDLEGRVVDANDRAVAAYGWARDELQGARVTQLAPAADTGAVEARLRTVADQGSCRFEAVHRRRDGTTFPVEGSSRAFEAEGRRLIYATFRDLSDRKALEGAARMQGSLLARLNDAVVAVDRERRITAWTGAAERVYGFSGAEALGRRFADLVRAPAVDARWDELAGEAERAGAAHADGHHLRKDGSGIEVQVTFAPLRDDGGRVVGSLLVARDVTRERRLQAQLVFADRLASIGTLAAGVAHEINNPLSYLLANFEFLEDRFAAGERSDPDALQAVREARDGARRIAEIVRGLRTFSRHERDPRPPAALDLRQPLRAAARIAESLVRPRARLVLALEPSPPVAATEHELAQVALNLLVNAVQALPDGRPEAHEVRVASGPRAGGGAFFEVRDTGAGVRPEHLSRIFDPFFTTKPVGEGSGLGLAICHGIVEGLGGSIEVESVPGRGSTFRVVLPAAQAVPFALERPSPPPSRRRGRVLVVDDEALVCRAVARTLAREHEVVEETDPVRALALLEAGERVDLVLCDLMMPGLTGMELHESLARRRPDLASGMIFLTGGAFTDSARSFLERVPNRRVEKPFDADVLRRAVSEAMGAGAAGAARA